MAANATPRLTMSCAPSTRLAPTGVVSSLRKMPRSRYPARTAGMPCMAKVAVTKAISTGSYTATSLSPPSCESGPPAKSPITLSRTIGKAMPHKRGSGSRSRSLASTNTNFLNGCMTSPCFTWPVSIWPVSIWPVSIWPVSIWPVSIWPVSIWPVSIFPVSIWAVSIWPGFI